MGLSYLPEGARYLYSEMLVAIQNSSVKRQASSIPAFSRQLVMRILVLVQGAMAEKVIWKLQKLANVIQST